MPEQQTSKNFFRLNGGLNTESNEIGFPDGFTTDEANYELLTDGSRRRRKGLAEESGQGAVKYTTTFTNTQRCQAYIWRNVGGDPNKDVYVYRQGQYIFFADADETISGGWATGDSLVDLTEFKTSGATTANSDDAPVSFSQGRGRLLVSGQYIKPFYVEYDGTSYSATIIKLRIRDFGDIEDGIAVNQYPTGTITDDHRYNLRNRGWKEADMDQFFSDEAKHPTKSSIWWKGYKRTYGASVAEQDGQRSWDSDKMLNEAFGSSSAPRGSLFIEPFDSTFGYGAGGAGGELVNITTWSYVDNGSYWTVTITTDAAHGLNVGDDFTIDGNSMRYEVEFYPGETWEATKSMDGTWTAKTGTTGSTLVFDWTDEPNTFDSWIDQYQSLGTVDGSLSIARSNGVAHTDSVACVEWHAGRAFYSGMSNEEWADTVFYSQIVDTASKFGRCYQEADPTDEYFNSVVSSDGGTIVIPGMGGIIEMKSVRGALLVFGQDGVWEIAGNRQGGFTADGFSVRKITDAGASSNTSIVRIEDSVVYTGPGGIFIIAPNQYTGQLEATNAIEANIQTLWNQVTTAQQERCAAFYDDAQKRAYFMLGPDGSTSAYVDTMLIFDARIGAWFKYTFDDTQTNLGILTGEAIPTADDPTTNKKCKFIYQASLTDAVNVADFDQTGFDDVTGMTQQLPYMFTGWDNLGDFQRRRQAPVITVYSKRTETGWTDAGGGILTPVNESSTLMSALWDWTDAKQWTSAAKTAQEDFDPADAESTNPSVSGKIFRGIQVYRHTRNYVPATTSDVDGYPAVVTRNKVRGRGRVLQLHFKGEADKDSHLLGFTVNYKVSARK